MIEITHIEPSTKVAKYVRKITFFNSNGKIKYRQKLTPSAFTYLSYNHKDVPISVYGNKSVKPNQRLQIAGPKLNEDIYVEYDGVLFQILIEFTASGFYYLFDSSPSKFLNGLSNLNNLVPKEITEKLELELLECKKSNFMIKLIEEFLFNRIQCSLPFNDYIEKSLTIFEQNHGSVQIAVLAKKVGISERQFERKFSEVVGMSPKRYSKLLQLHYVINLMNLKQYGSIKNLAYQAEFYDLAHFTNRFKELTGFAPSEFIKSQKHIALKYFNDLIE